jgi:hypothetical protein
VQTLQVVTSESRGATIKKEQAMQKTEEILQNVIWLVDAFDDEALEEVQDIPFLEMAKVVSIAPPSSVRSARFEYLVDNRNS